MWPAKAVSVASGSIQEKSNLNLLKSVYGYICLIELLALQCVFAQEQLGYIENFFCAPVLFFFDLFILRLN